MAVGTLGTLVLIALSPTVQIDLLHRAEAWFPLRNPALVTVPLSFAAGILVSLASAPTTGTAGFQEWERRMHLGPMEE